MLQLLFLTSRAAAALAATGSPTPEELATGVKAAQMLADFGKVYFRARRRRRQPCRPTIGPQGLKQIEDQAEATQFQIALYPAASALKAGPNDPAACAAAEPLFRKAAEQYPNAGALAQQLAAVTRCQQTKDPKKVQQALYYYARAVVDPVGGVGGLDEKGQKALDDFLKKIYTTIHGSDEGLAQLKEMVAKAPNPPDDFKVKTASEIAAAEEEEFRTKNPQLAMWMSIKGQLADTNGQQYFEETLKEHDMSGENGAKLLKGTLLEAKPACKAKELLVAIPMPNATGAPVPEITLKLDPALNRQSGDWSGDPVQRRARGIRQGALHAHHGVGKRQDRRFEYHSLRSGAREKGSHCPEKGRRVIAIYLWGWAARSPPAVSSRLHLSPGNSIPCSLAPPARCGC